MNGLADWVFGTFVPDAVAVAVFALFSVMALFVLFIIVDAIVRMFR